MSDLRAAIIPVTPFEQNCTLLWSDKTKVGAVIDPGGDLDRVREAIAQNGVTVEKITSDAWPYRSRGRARRVEGGARRADRGSARG